MPSELPDDLGGKAKYGFLVDLRKEFLLKNVFLDTEKYSDSDRDNARQAAKLIIELTTEDMEEAGKENDSMLYLRAVSYENLYHDTKDEEYKDKALSDYEKMLELGANYAKGEYEKLQELKLTAAPLEWTIAQVLSLEDIADALDVDSSLLALTHSTYESLGPNRTAVGYVFKDLDTDEDMIIWATVDKMGGEDRFKILSSMAFLGILEELKDVDEKAVIITEANVQNSPTIYKSLVSLYGDLVLSLKVPERLPSSVQVNSKELAVALGKKALENIFDKDYSLATVREEDFISLPNKMALDIDQDTSPVPQQIPEDLGGKTEYGFFVDTRKDYLPGSLFSSDTYSDDDKNNGRAAINVLVNGINEGFDRVGLDPYQMEIRAYSYFLAYLDSKNILYRNLAINDYKHALYKEYSFVKADYKTLTTPILEPMALLGKGDSGEDVLRLQNWLISAGYLKGSADGNFDKNTEAAIKAFEKENKLSEDGLVDIDFLLALFAQVIDEEILEK